MNQVSISEFKAKCIGRTKRFARALSPAKVAASKCPNAGLREGMKTLLQYAVGRVRGTS